MNSAVQLILCLLIPLAAGFVGSAFTTPSIPTWYAALNKPSFNPPNWIFAPVWTTLFILMGIALFIVWKKGIKTPGVKAAIVIFAVQLVLNTGWSLLFFGLHSPFYAFIEIIFLWLAIALTIVSFWKLSPAASLLLVPYLCWVSFASYLNFTVWRLNP
jgi:translocator protein